jgi:hypothetical protein
MPRYFTLEQAQRMLPEVERLLRKSIQAKGTYQEAEAEFRTLSERILATGGLRVDPVETLALRARRDQAAERLKEAMEVISGLGVQIKDLDVGLIDFPTLYRGAEVLLCWRLGERDIAFWHGLEEGFRGRKPIDRDFLEHHSGDQPN